MIEETVAIIEKQTGTKLTLCDHFSGVREMNGEKYFNVIFNDPLFCSADANAISRYAQKHKSIRVEACGYKRMSVFPQV